MRQLPYRLGVIIPVFLILFIGNVCYFQILRFDENPLPRRIFLIGYCFVWISYSLAIYSDPGKVNPQLATDEFVVWCSKCEAPKPERTHHCKTCGRCVLKMDHHCPWTINCVGHANLPHFIRFLSWVNVVTGYTLYRFIDYFAGLYRDRYRPGYLLSKSGLTLTIFGFLAALLVVVSVGILWIRVVYNLINGNTQIEDWEMERVAVLARRKIARRMEFPFDVDLWTNIVDGMGQPWTWLNPLAGPQGNGHVFKKVYATKQRWPPPLSEGAHEFYRTERWLNNDGENVADYGVDTEVEAEALPAQQAAASAPATSSASQSVREKKDSREDEPLSELRARLAH